MRVIKCIAFLLIIIVNKHIYPLTVGSDALVSRSNFVTFPQVSLLTPNAIQGFVLMDQGFSLQNAATSLIYDGAFPIVQNIFLNGGTLNLSRDMSLENVTTFTSLGVIIGNGNMITLPSSLQSMGQSNILKGYFDSLVLSINSALDLDAQITFSGNSEINGKNNKIIFTSNGSIVVESGSTLTLRNLEIEKLSGANLMCKDDNASIVLQNVKFDFDNLYTFSVGSIEFIDQVTFSGTGTFLYASKQTSTIAADSVLHITDSTCLNVGANTISGQQPLYFSDQQSSLLLLDDCYFYVRYPGIQVTGGTISLDRNVSIDMDSTSSQNGLIVGDGISSSQDGIIYFSPAATTVINTGCFTYNNVDPNQFLSHSKSSRLIRTPGANTYIAKNWNLYNITSQVTSYAASSLQFAPGVTLTYSNVDVEFPDALFNVNGSMAVATTFLLTGNQYLSLYKGSFLAAVAALGSGNFLQGVGTIEGPVFLSGPTAELTWDALGSLQAPMSLNGGTLLLSNKLILGQNIVINGPGTVACGSNFISVNSDGVAIWSSPINFSATKGGLEFDSNILLTSTWVCSGTVVMDGKGHDLDAGNVGQIVVDSNSTLILQNVILKNIAGTQISCVDDSATIQLQNVKWYLDDVYTFSYGSIAYVDTVSFSGTGTFAYDSAQTSTVSSNSKLSIADGLTFNLSRSQGSINQPYYFTNNSSQLVLDNCYFLVNYPGFMVTRGTLFLNRNIMVDIAGTSTSTGMIIGDGVSSDNDVIIYYFPGAVSTFNSGYLTHNNVNPDKVKSFSTNSKIVRNLNANMYIAKNWNLSSITSAVSSNAASPLEFAPNTTLSFTDVTISFPEINFDVTGNMSSSAFSINLNGNGDYLSLTKGSYPLGLIVSGQNNSVIGNGKVSGPIILTGSTAQLTWDALDTITVTPLLNGGTLSLDHDINLAPQITIAGPGTIELNNNFINIDSQLNNPWSTPLNFVGSGGGLSFYSHTSLSNIWTCSGSIIIDGQEHVLDLDSAGKIIVAPNSSLTLQNMTLKNAHYDKIACADDSGTIVLQNINWILDEIYTFSYGTFNVIDSLNYLGTGTFLYASEQTSTIAANTNFHVSNGVTFMLGRNAVSGKEPYYFTNSTSQMTLDNCNFNVQYPGLQVTRGTLSLNRNIIVDINSTSSATGLIVGDGVNPDNDATVYYSPGAITLFNSGDIVYNNANSDKFYSASNTAKIVRNVGANMYVATPWNLSNITSEVSSYLASPIGFAPAASLNFNNVTIAFPDILFDVTGSLANPTYFSLLGNHYLSLYKGSYISGTMVMGQNNFIYGNGKITGPIFMTDSTAQLTWDALGSITANPILNGGTLLLNKNLKLGPQVSITGPGALNTAAHTISIDMQDTAWESPLNIIGDQGGIKLISNMHLSNIWTCSGVVRINGGNHSLDLGTTGSLVVASGSTLNLQNMILKNVSGLNIRCEDETAQIILQNVQIEAVGDIRFPYGSIVFEKKNKMKGSYVFAYESSQTSTIQTQSSLILDLNFTFSYYPSNYASNLLQFIDDTSQLTLNNASLVATCSGMSLTTGTLFAKGVCAINSDICLIPSEIDGSLVTNNGIILGDGLSSINDMKCLISNGSQIKIDTGKIVYKNIESSSFVMQNKLSSMYFLPGTSLRLLSTLDLGLGQIIFGDSCLLELAAGIDLLGATVPLGRLYRASIG